MRNLTRWTSGAPSLLGPLDPPDRRLDLDPESEPAIVLFRVGDVCGDCGGPLKIVSPQEAYCPHCRNADPLPF